MTDSEPDPPAGPRPLPDAGDRGWIREALEAFEAPLIQYARRVVGDLERARDVVQDTFLKLCEQDRSAVEERLREWLFTVCRNRALDVQRKERPMTSITEEAAERSGHPDPHGDPARTLAERDTASHVLALVNRLPENQRDVLLLKFQAGLSYKEISRATKLTVGNVGYLIHVGLKAIRGQMEESLLEGSKP